MEFGLYGKRFSKEEQKAAVVRSCMQQWGKGLEGNDGRDIESQPNLSSSYSMILSVSKKIAAIGVSFLARLCSSTGNIGVSEEKTIVHLRKVRE